jgi:hypothetical protein
VPAGYGLLAKVVIHEFCSTQISRICSNLKPGFADTSILYRVRVAPALWSWSRDDLLARGSTESPEAYLTYSLTEAVELSSPGFESV